MPAPPATAETYQSRDTCLRSWVMTRKETRVCGKQKDALDQ
jgi:hypothetical protein